MADDDKDKKLTKKDAEVNLELGIGQIFPGSLWTDWDGTGGGTLINKPAVTLDQLVEMRRRDGQAKALIQLVTLPLRTALQEGEWIDPPEGDSKEETEFANKLWNLPPMGGGMTTSKNKLIRQILLSVTDGFAAFEIVRHIPTDGPLKGKITLQKLAYRDPRTIKFRIDKKGGYNGFRQTTHDGEGQLIDVSLDPIKTVTFTHHDELNPYYGVSLFESAYPHFDAKKKLYYIAHLAAQFAAVPGRIGMLPPNPKPSDVNQFRQALTNFAFNAAMVVPNEYKVENFAGRAQFDFMNLIDHHNMQMSKSVLAPFFDSDQRPVLIENTNGDASADLFLMCMESIAADIAEILTVHLMPQFIDFNFSSKKYPVFRPGKLSDSSKALIKEVFDTVSVAGILNVTPELVRETEKKMTARMGLDIDYETIEKNEKKAAIEQQKQAEAQAEQEAAIQQQQMAANQAQQQQEMAIKQQAVQQKAPVVPPSPDQQRAEAQARLSGAVEGIDELVLAAQNLFLSKPDEIEDPEPIDEGVPVLEDEGENGSASG